MSGIEAVIWDMGGIIYKTPFEVLDEVERELGLPVGSLPRGPFSPEGDPEYAKISTGSLSEPAYFAGFIEEAQARGSPADLLERIDWRNGLRPEVLEAIDRINEHYVQATLSNDSSRWLGDEWWLTWPYRHKFASVIDVKTLGVRKPDPAAYLASSDDLGLPPERCLFVDDMHKNVDGAEAVGMHGFFFDHTDVSGSLDRLFHRLDLPPR